ncbi:MAG: SdrD B-like domain-containing protein, partial [Acidimicrobiales bacterium]
MAPVRPPRVAVALIAALLVLASTAAATARPARAATPSTAAPSAAAPASAEPTSAPVVAPAGSAGPATAAAEPDAVPGPRSEVLAGPQLSPADQAAVALADRRAAQAGAAPPGATASAPGSTFQVNYSGFTPAARAAFQRAVDAWAAVLVSPMPIVINATYTTLPPNVLGSAGPKALYRVNGGPFPGQLYPVALANALTSRDLDTAGEDIDATFSSTANWYLGTDGQVPQGQYDFTTVVLHELGHGLGFIGSATDDGTNGHLGLSGNPTFTTPYDMLAENGSGTALSTLANPSVALHSALTSSTWLDGSAIRAANGGRPARLYTPGTWSAGSSYSHFDDASHAPSDPDALMTPVLSGGEVHTVPGPLATAVMVDSGWSTVAAPTGTLTGTVRTASPAGAAAGVTVDVLRPSSTTIVASTTTDASGAYRLTGLGSASYQVRFSDGQGRWPTVWSGDSPTQGGSATVATVDGTTVTLDATL